MERIDEHCSAQLRNAIFLTIFGGISSAQKNLHPNQMPGKARSSQAATPSTEALKKGRPIDCIYILKGADRGSVGKIIALAKERGVPVKDAAAQKLDALCGGVVHQGVAAMAACHDFSTMEDIFAKGRRPAGPLSSSATTSRTRITWAPSSEPQRPPARTASSSPKRRGVGLTATVAKTSAGAVEYMPVVAGGQHRLHHRGVKQKGLWIFCADMDGKPWCSGRYGRADRHRRWGRGSGVSRLTKEHCDFVVSLPMNGQVNSLNASVAAAIVIYEAVRQRSGLPAFTSIK